MALICNGYRLGQGPHKFIGSATTIYNGSSFRGITITGRLRNLTAGEGLDSDKIGVPMGTLHPLSWIMPQKAGNVSSHNEAQGSATATLQLVAGRNIAGQSDGVADATATAKLVVSTSASAAGDCTASGTLIAILEMSGSAAGGCTASAVKNALAWAAGNIIGASSATLGSYATGRLSGTVYVNQSEATVTQIVDGVWNAQTSDHNDSGTMGEAMGAAGTAGDPWTTELPGSYSGDQAGAVIGNQILTTERFLALK